MKLFDFLRRKHALVKSLQDAEKLYDDLIANPRKSVMLWDNGHADRHIQISRSSNKFACNLRIYDTKNNTTCNFTTYRSKVVKILYKFRNTLTLKDATTIISTSDD